MTASVEIGILTTDADLVVRSWDAWLTDATGLQPEAVCGRPLAEIAPASGSGTLAARLQETVTAGAVHVLSPGLHGCVIPCPPRHPSRHFTRMQQRVHIGPLLDGGRIAGVMLTITDVTQRIDAERALAEDLASEDPERRRHASERLASTGVESLDPFTPALGADDWKVRQATVHGLARSADRDLLHAVVDTLRRNHRNFNALSSALKLLALSEIPFTGPLQELLSDSDRDLRIQAALALGDQQDPAAVGALLGALDDADVNVRFHAIEALGRLRAIEAVERLAAIAEEGDFFLSFAAIDALSMISDPSIAPRLAPLLADDSLQQAVAAALGTVGDEQAIAPLVECLNTSVHAAPTIATALVAIAQRQEQLLGQGARVASRVGELVNAEGERNLIAGLRNADAGALPAIVRLLGWLRRESAAPELVTLLGRRDIRDDIIEALVRHGEQIIEPVAAQLSSDDAAIRGAAIATLGRLGSRRATAALLPLLHEEPETVIAATGALARIGDPAAFDPLLALVSHENPAVRQAVVGALNSIGHPDMPARVAALLDAPDAHARESAVRIAGYFGYSETADAIIARANDHVESVRIAALEHLPFLEDPRAFDLLRRAVLEDSPKARAAAARALGRLHEPGVAEVLTDAVRDPDPWVRYYAVRSAAERADTDAMPALIERATRDEAVHVRIAALDALGATASQDAVDTLIVFAADPDDNVASAALTALGHVGGERVLTHLIDATRSASETRRRAAVLGLARDGSVGAVTSLEWLAAADDAQTADLAVNALGQIAVTEAPGAETAVEALTELLGDARRADAAAVVLCRLPASRVAAVARGLQHPQAAVRQRTVTTLGRFTAADTSTWLLTALADSAAAVREAAVLTLTRMNARGLDAQLADLARSDSSKRVRRAAAAAVARMRSPGPA